jgi:glycyl-tRNA synthetase (class II)
LRDRDSLAQDRVAIDALPDEVAKRVAAPWRSPKLAG